MSFWNTRNILIGVGLAVGTVATGGGLLLAAGVGAAGMGASWLASNEGQIGDIGSFIERQTQEDGLLGWLGGIRRRFAGFEWRKKAYAAFSAGVESIALWLAPFLGPFFGGRAAFTENVRSFFGVPSDSVTDRPEAYSGRQPQASVTAAAPAAAPADMVGTSFTTGGNGQSASSRPPTMRDEFNPEGLSTTSGVQDTPSTLGFNGSASNGGRVATSYVDTSRTKTFETEIPIGR